MAVRPCDVRARELLFSVLTEEELLGWPTGVLYVKGGVTGTTYEVHLGYSQNVWANTVFPENNVRRCKCPDCAPDNYKVRRRNFCYHMREADLPTYDHMLAQVLYIKFNEEEFTHNAYVSC